MAGCRPSRGDRWHSLVPRAGRLRCGAGEGEGSASRLPPRHQRAQEQPDTQDSRDPGGDADPGMERPVAQPGFRGEHAKGVADGQQGKRQCRCCVTRSAGSRPAPGERGHVGCEDPEQEGGPPLRQDAVPSISLRSCSRRPSLRFCARAPAPDQSNPSYSKGSSSAPSPSSQAVTVTAPITSPKITAAIVSVRRTM